MNGINEYLNDNERQGLINDILTVYNYGPEGIKKLRKMSDDQLFAYREDLRRRGKIERFLPGRFSIHISAFMNKFSANTYITFTAWDNGKLYTTFYMGLVDKETMPDYLGHIKLDEQWKIVEVVMFGDTLKRYNGLELIIDGKKG